MDPAKQLEEQGYSLDAAMHHNELIPFVVTHLFRKNFMTLGFLACNILFVSLWLVTCGYYLWNGVLSFNGLLKWSGFGALVILPLIPVHEILHGIAYRICGAKHVSYKANWRKMYFMAIAHNFVTVRKAFYFIGLTPFIIISLGTFIAAVVALPEYRVMWLSALWLHATMCAGDFGLMSYFRENRQKEVITYDDAEQELSYFWSRNLQS